MRHVLLLFLFGCYFSVFSYTGKSFLSQDFKNDIIDRYIISVINDQVDKNDLLSSQKRYTEVNYIIDARNSLVKTHITLPSDFITSTNHYLNQQQGAFQGGKSYACYVLLTSEKDTYTDQSIVQMLEYLNRKERLTDINLQSVEEIKRLYYKMGGDLVTLPLIETSGNMATDHPVEHNLVVETEENRRKGQTDLQKYLSGSRLGDDKHLGVLLHYFNAYYLRPSGLSFSTIVSIAFDTNINEATRLRVEAALQDYDFDAFLNSEKSGNNNYNHFLQGMITANVKQILQGTLDTYLSSSEAIYSTEASHIIQFILDNECDYTEALDSRLNEGHYNYMRASDRLLVLNMVSQNEMHGDEESITIKVLKGTLLKYNESGIPLILSGLKSPAQKRTCKKFSATDQVKVTYFKISLLAKLHYGIDNFDPAYLSTYGGSGGNYDEFVSAITSIVKLDPNFSTRVTELIDSEEFEKRYINWDQERQFKESYEENGEITSYIKNVNFIDGNISYDYYPLCTKIELVATGCPGPYFVQRGHQPTCYKYKYYHSRNAVPVKISDPFALVMFTTMTNSSMFSGVVGSGKNIVAVPAYFLYAMHTTEFTQNAIQASMFALDVVSLITAPGALRAATTRLASYIVLLDVASSAASIVNNTDLHTNLPEPLQVALQEFEALTGIVGLGHGGVGMTVSCLQLGKYVKAQAKKIDLNGIKLGIEKTCIDLNRILTDEKIVLTATTKQQIYILKAALENKLRYYYNYTIDYIQFIINNITGGFYANAEIQGSLSVISNLRSSNKLARSIGTATNLELACIHKYTEWGNIILDKMRNGNETILELVSFTEFESQLYNTIRSGLTKLRNTDRLVTTTVLRGRTYKLEDFNLLFNSGKANVPLKGFISCTRNEDVAIDFLSKSGKSIIGPKVKVIMRIKSKNGVDIDDISDWGANLVAEKHPGNLIQQEVLLEEGYFKMIGQPKTFKIEMTIDGPIEWKVIELEELGVPLRKIN